MKMKFGLYCVLFCLLFILPAGLITMALLSPDFHLGTAVLIWVPLTGAGALSVCFWCYNRERRRRYNLMAGDRY